MQIGEYFGYSILANDFDNDGLDDIIVSAPMHGTTGIVYYLSNKKASIHRCPPLCSVLNPLSRFSI